MIGAISRADAPVALDPATVHSFAAGLRGALICAGDAAYDSARAVWNGMIDRRPALIARCAGTDDVVKAVEFARNHGMLDQRGHLNRNLRLPE